MNLQKFKQSVSDNRNKLASAVGAVGVLLLTVPHAFALNTLSGAYIPAGTANNFIADVNTAFIPFLIQLAFQHELISLFVIGAGIFVLWMVLRMAWSRFRMRH